MNRVLKMISTVESNITTKGLPKEKLASMHKGLDMEFTEYCRFQEMKSIASIDGSLTLEEAQTVYDYLGNAPDHFNRQPLPVKIVLTKLFSELLERHIVKRTVAA